MISGRSQVLGVFGDPVSHSLSPPMHAEFARSTGMDTVYVPFRVQPHHLETALGALPALSILGVNLTVPHKESALQLLPEVAPAAQQIGAINTVTNRAGDLVGENTDAEGFLADLRAQFPEQGWEGKPTLILGAGGAARAVIYALRQAGVPRLVVANRTWEKARSLVEALCPDTGEAIPMEGAGLESAISQAGLIVNTTSLGLKAEALPGIDLTRVHAGTAIYDLIYNPFETPFLRQAKDLGLPRANGLGMLVRQGAASYARWTGRQPMVAPTLERLRDQLKDPG